jgi:uncharacterized protein YdiU (UPF0061 family)
MSAPDTRACTNPIVRSRYRELPEGFFSESRPDASPKPRLIEVNQALLAQLGINTDWFGSDEGLAVLSGNSRYDDTAPIALAYSGHQFGHWVPILGDGRAHLLGEMKRANGSRVDVQLKGSGRTRFSRGGDGRATLGAVLREYLISEAMAGLGIPTTRSVAIVATGETVMREQRLPGAILARTAQSHVRVGTFQYAAAHLGQEQVQALADFVITHHFPEVKGSPSRYLELLSAIIERQAVLIAQWMLAGFIHGVMNTDNMSIVGETIDYGPCAFMDEFQPDKVFSSIDRFGRYAWDQQPAIAHWNLTRLAETLLPLFDSDTNKAVSLAEARLERFASRFSDAFWKGLTQKLGLPESNDDAMRFAESLFPLLTEGRIDFTIFFDRLTRVAHGDSDALVLELFSDQPEVVAWLEQWKTLKAKDADTLSTMRHANPAIIARNHRVEQAIDAATCQQDFAPFRRLCRALANPFEVSPADQDLQNAPRPEERVMQTFCGT